MQPFLNSSDYIFFLEYHIERGEQHKQFGLTEVVTAVPNGAPTHISNTQLPKISDLLRSLINDLQYAFDNFINEFLMNDGINYLLNLLALCLSRQQSPAINANDCADIVSIKERHHQLKRAMHDEYDCLVCLNISVKRNTKSLQKILLHHSGLSTIASCIVSNLVKSRLIALQLLTKVCSQTNGVNKVLEAMATIRIIFGESVRFKFLVSMLNSVNNCSVNGIEYNALYFLNAILNQTNNIAEKIRIFCELDEAGFNVNNFEKLIQEKGISKEEPIWTEIRRFRSEYVNIYETLKSKKQIKESVVLKEEVKVLKMALTKLEEDKINLMQIERELKEKCDDLEQEVGELKSKFDVFIPQNASLNKKEAYNEVDSDIAKSNKRPEELNVFNEDQNMRNEDELIYIPAIRPPPSFAQYAQRETQIQANRKEGLKYLLKSNVSDETDWRQTSADKPTVVNVYPKRKHYNMGAYSESTIGTDRENSEIILDCKYFSYDMNQEKSISSSKHKSRSMNEVDIEPDYDLPNNAQFSRVICKSNINLSFNSKQNLMSTNSKNISRSNSFLSECSNKSKNNTQSYLFSGISSVNQYKKDDKSFDEITFKSFPIPKTYKRNFILKGHGNCGRYSGIGDKQSITNNLSDNVKIGSQNNASILVHKEITKATQDIGSIGSWF